MRPSNLNSASGRLQEALDDLQQAWLDTRQFWNDSQADYFEKQYLEKISATVTSSFPVIGHLSNILGTAHRDCTE